MDERVSIVSKNLECGRTAGGYKTYLEAGLANLRITGWVQSLRHQSNRCGGGASPASTRRS